MFAAEDNINNPQMIQTLMTAGADINAKDIDGWTALMFSITSPEVSNNDVVEEIIKSGANIDMKNEEGKTALILAAEIGSFPEIVETLLKRGANAKIKDRSGRTALDYSEENENIKDTKAYKLLVEANGEKP
jgi:ankyrin repeat protein